MMRSGFPSPSILECNIYFNFCRYIFTTLSKPNGGCAPRGAGRGRLVDRAQRSRERRGGVVERRAGRRVHGARRGAPGVGGAGGRARHRVRRRAGARHLGARAACRGARPRAPRRRARSGPRRDRRLPRAAGPRPGRPAHRRLGGGPVGGGVVDRARHPREAGRGAEGRALRRSGVHGARRHRARLEPGAAAHRAGARRAVRGARADRLDGGAAEEEGRCRRSS